MNLLVKQIFFTEAVM